jgi:hypothetical protein
MFLSIRCFQLKNSAPLRETFIFLSLLARPLLRNRYG